MSKVTITSSFWGRYRELVRSEMIPYQWNVLNDIAGITIEKERDDAGIPSEKSHAIENFTAKHIKAKKRKLKATLNTPEASFLVIFL